jgi:ABC-type multidrug transport system ATPase subunit
VERICDRVAVLSKGKIVFESAMDELKYQKDSKSITLEYDQAVDADRILRVLNENGLAPTNYVTSEICIESVYLEVAG